MEDNPFAMLAKIIRDDNMSRIPVSFRFGRVISKDPLTLDVAGTIQDKSSLLKNSAVSYFTEGDRLLLVPIEDEQRYIILCKVVGV
jgi:hypothetical protein